MRLYQARKEAKEMLADLKPWKKIQFEMLDEEDRITKCEWVDPNDGTFQIQGVNGFVMVDDYMTKDFMVQNVRIVDKR